MEDEHISFPLVSDSRKADGQIDGRDRITFIMDKNGIMRFVQKGGSQNEDFTRRLEMLQ